MTHTFILTLFVNKFHFSLKTLCHKKRRDCLTTCDYETFKLSFPLWNISITDPFFSILVLEALITVQYVHHMDIGVAASAVYWSSAWFSCGLKGSILWKNWRDSWPENYLHLGQMNSRQQEIWEKLLVGWQVEKSVLRAMWPWTIL